jgi:parallel beta-helix repeat protein
MDRDTATSRLVLTLLILFIVMLVFVVSAGNGVISGISDPDAVGLDATYKSEDLGVKTTEKLQDADKSTNGSDAGRDVHLTAGSSVTCTSCEDCTRKLNNGFYDTVILSQNILNYTGNCITLSADNVVFDCSGYFISGDLPVAPFNVDYGIKVTGDNNVITNCNVGLFWYGIWLDSANFTTITKNNLALNGYAGLTLANSNNNNITANTMNFNSYGLAILNSDNTVINSNAACGNLIADIWQENSSGNAGSNNTCYNTHNWNDTGTVDCTHLCCLVPSDDMRIEKDTKFCPGWYNIADSGAQGAIIINTSNVVLDGNGATIIGSGAGYGIYNSGFDNVTITNVTILNYGTGIQLVEANNSIISKNNVSYSATKGIAVDSSYHCDVAHNRVSYSAERGIAFGGGGDNAAYNNVAYNNSAFGAIEAVFSDNNEIYNNTAYFNQWGIATNHGSYNQIHNNTMYGNELGIHLDWPSTNNSVVNNNISSNHAGILTNHNSTDNIISGNLIVANEAAGIGIETNDNTIINNTARSNRVGLYLGATTTGNTITHNSFCNNIVFDIRDDNSNSGDENTCDTQSGWDDAGTTGCTYPCVCGGADLIITDIWSEGEFIWYQVRNIGNDTAPEGHWTGLLVDEVYVVKEQVAVALAPGERYTGFFGYSWCCTGGEDVIAVVADYNHHVPEANETNNRREEVWKCDTIPPRITAGPTVSEITQTSALVTWETDEASTSTVQYGNTARFYPFGQTDATLVQEHELVLTGLEPSTTYNVVVLSTDNGSNTVQSDDITFETAPLPDTEDPIVTLIDPGVCRGVVNLHATAADNIGVEKVEFYIDDHLIFTDFVPPYSAFFDSFTYSNGLHKLAVKALDHRGRSSRIERTVNVHNFIDVTAPQVKITAPTPGENVSGTVSINVSLSDDAGLVEAFLFIDIENFVRGHKSWKQPYPTNATLSLWWDTTKFENGSHTIGIEAWDNSGKRNNMSISAVTVEVYNEPPTPPKYPELRVMGQIVSRAENQFSISLYVKNFGDDNATNISIMHGLRGFQPIERHSVSGDYLAYYGQNTCYCEIKPNHSIEPGHTAVYTYAAVPIMIYPEPAGWSPQIGHYLYLSYDSPNGGGFHEVPPPLPVATTATGETLSDAYDSAIKASDFLIITNTWRLFYLFGDQKEDVNELLSTMARLAFDEHGVLGYLNWKIPQLKSYDLRKLIQVNGNWSKQMNPKFTSVLGGYVLLVGEEEIIPAWEIGPVHFSDQPYAGKQAPELIVSRIIGNTPSNMSNAIQSSIGVKEGWPGYTFDRSHALLVSGTGDGTAEFVKNVNDMANILDKSGVNVTKIHWKDFPNSSGQVQVFKLNATDKDVICFRDHGSPDSWDSLHTYDVAGNSKLNITPLELGDTKPFAFALACLTGNYENHITYDGGDYNIAEAFLDRGTAVYIGSTEVSNRGKNNVAGKTFFKTWDASESIGYAFTAMERSLWNTHFEWSEMYNLYGDPKFGATASTSLAAPLTKEKVGEPKASLDIVVPDYEVNTINGTDYVEIPGGDLLLQEDWPEVPIYTISIDYPSGYEVQNVVLTNRSGLIIDTGLNLPIYHIEWDYPHIDTSYTVANGEEWYPDEVYSWHSWDNCDGSISLVITLYPFYYNSLSTDIRFYKNYSFNITYTISNVSITSLRTDRTEYPQDDTVMVDLGLNNSDDTWDVVVSAVVKRYGSDELVDGLLLCTLKNFTGPSSFSPQWNSSGFEPGYYIIEVTLEDTEGNVLDRETVLFRLGISVGEITTFTATPDEFELGDEITINMTFANTGTVNLTGTAIVRVITRAGDTVEEYGQNVTDLLPSESISFCDTWNTTSAAEGLYSILGYVLYESMSTDPASVMVGTKTGGFDTGPGIYPSIAGTHNGTITPNQTMLVRRLYTYPCNGTGGHAEYVKIWQGMEALVEAEWTGYSGDWQNITFDAPIVLEANETYYYTITTCSYPQIIHEPSWNATGGKITCTEFVDINGKRHEGWIPAIKLY